jgi:CARDB
MMRRLIAAGAILVVLILIVLGVRSCQISARNTSLKDYTNNVSSLNQASAQTGQQFFNQLSSGAGGGSGGSNALQTQLNETRIQAENQLNRAHNLDVPDEMKGAQQNFLLALQMRRDGIAGVASRVGEALGGTTSKDAVNAIAATMARFYASDVLYKDYTTPLISGALKSVNIAVGGDTGVSIDAHQFLPDIQWLTPTFVASKFGAQVSTPNGKPAPGLHGHSLDSVSVGGTTLDSGSTNTLPAGQPPTFTLNITNGGQNTEHNIICKISISGTSATGQTTIPQTTAGQSTSCQVHLNSAPPAGNYTLTANISQVPGEKNTANNTLTFPVTFQ